METPLYPHVNVKLVGEDGNAFAIVGRVKDALLRHGHHAAAEEYAREAFSGDYNHLLMTTLKYVSSTDEDEWDEDADWFDDGGDW